MAHAHSVDGVTYRFPDLRTLLARASPHRSGDALAGVAAQSAEERMAARMALADLPLSAFLTESVVPYEEDDVTRLILDSHDKAAFAPVAALTVGEFREWLLTLSSEQVTALAPGLVPEMAAAVSKLMRNQDLVSVARKCRVVTRFRNTIGLPGRLAVRLQPNHPTDDPRGIAASMLDGLMYGCGDAVIGVNPAGDGLAALLPLWKMMDELISRFSIPTQSCVLTHVTNQLRAIEQGAPVDLVFQSIGGTQKTNESFGVSLSLLREAMQAARSLKRGTLGENVMYFETGQGSSLSAGAHHGCDQQTLEARAYGVARAYQPLLVNTVVGFIGPEYLFDGKQIIRAGLEDHFCGKLLGVPLYRGRPGRHGHAAHAPRRRGGHLHHGRARGGRRDAQLPEQLVPRRFVPARGDGPEARARVRGVAGEDGHRGCGRAAGSCSADAAACAGEGARVTKSG
jgi:ethanolamine ammonia-lyase large subunit